MGLHMATKTSHDWAFTLYRHQRSCTELSRPTWHAQLLISVCNAAVTEAILCCANGQQSCQSPGQRRNLTTDQAEQVHA